MKQNEVIEGMRVEAGEGEEHDTGVVHSIDGDNAVVGWDSGVTTPVPIQDLRPTSEHHSGGHRLDSPQS
jgi:hypothetical protein